MKFNKNLCWIAAFYFTANIQAQTKKDSLGEKKIDEVVVIGYGTQKKSNVTGAIASIKASDIENIPAGKPVMTNDVLIKEMREQYWVKFICMTRK